MQKKCRCGHEYADHDYFYQFCSGGAIPHPVTYYRKPTGGTRYEITCECKEFKEVKKMKTKKELTRIARKAWRTRRDNLDIKNGIIPRSVDKRIIEQTVRLPKLKVKGRKYSKKVRHLAALRAWRTRRKNLR
jgi:hypothetical protein